MELETQILLKVNSMLDERFEGMERNVVVRATEDGTFKIYITSPDPEFLGKLIGKKGATAVRFKSAFSLWAEECNIKTLVWIERNPIQKMTEPQEFQISVEEIFPQGEMMLIEPIEFQGPKITKSGIHLGTEHVQATPTLGRIVRAGDEAKYKVGDMVFFRRYSLDQIEVSISSGKKTLNFIHHEDIISQYIPKP